MKARHQCRGAGKGWSRGGPRSAPHPHPMSHVPCPADVIQAVEMGQQLLLRIEDMESEWAAVRENNGLQRLNPPTDPLNSVTCHPAPVSFPPPPRMSARIIGFSPTVSGSPPHPRNAGLQCSGCVQE